jgi:hypothetical protein
MEGVQGWIATIATVVQTVVVVFGIGFAIVQLRQVRSARNLDTIQTVFEGFATTQAYKERWSILTAGTVRVDETDEEHFLLCMRTSDYFQRVGFLASHGFVDVAYVLRMYSGTILSLWQCLRPFVEYMRTTKGLSNYSYEFERLAKLAEAYRRTTFRGETIAFAASGTPASSAPAPTDAAPTDVAATDVAATDVAATDVAATDVAADDAAGPSASPAAS